MMALVKSDMGDGGWSVHFLNDDGSLGYLCAEGYADRDEYGDYVWPDPTDYEYRLEMKLV